MNSKIGLQIGHFPSSEPVDFEFFDNISANLIFLSGGIKDGGGFVYTECK
jgi:hypothetical protein